MNKYITISVDNIDAEYPYYDLEGKVPDELYVLSLLVQKDFYPDYLKGDAFDEKEDQFSRNRFVSIKRFQESIHIQAKKEYQMKNDDIFIMKFEDFVIMVEDWSLRFGSANKIFFILEKDNVINVQGDGMGWSPEQEV